MKLDTYKKMRSRIKALKDYDGTPILPTQIGSGWPVGKGYRYWIGEDFLYPDGLKLPCIRRELKLIRGHKLSKEDVKFIYRYKIR